MSQRPSTPVKVPSSAANYSPATLDPDLRSQINTVLLRDGHVTKIQEALLHSLNSHSTDWPAAVQAHALTLLRSGETTTFPALLRRVLDDIRNESVMSNASTNGKALNGESKKINGSTNDSRHALAVPSSVIDEALKVTRESLEAVCEIEETATS